MEPSLFDVIGPIMVGPSSSHTAGALKIALITRKLCPNKDFKKVTFELFGSFAETYKGHGTNKALVGGILGYPMNDIRIRDSFEYAKKEGFDFEFIENKGTNNYHPNTVKITIVSKDNSTFEVLGESIGGGLTRIRMINNIEVKLTGEYNTLLIEQYDRPGVLAHITSMLDAFNINIAFARLYRETKGEKAYTIVETDDDLDFNIINAINMNNNIISTIKFDVSSI